MSNSHKYTEMSDELYGYIVEHGTRADPVLEKVEAETSALGGTAVMQTGSDQGALLTVLTRAAGAKRALEVGTFTGYGAISIARGLAPDGQLVTLELDPERASASEGRFAEAGLADRVDVHVGPALESLRKLDPPFDLAYVDADKTGYDDYYEECLRLLRPGGLIALDNMLRGGTVLDPGDDEAAVAIDTLNKKIQADERVDVAMLSIGDGLTLAVKR